MNSFETNLRNIHCAFSERVNKHLLLTVLDCDLHHASDV